MSIKVKHNSHICVASPLVAYCETLQITILFSGHKHFLTFCLYELLVLTA